MQPRVGFARSRVAAFLTDRCTVQRPGTAVSDDAGGWPAPWVDVPGLVGVPCAIAPLGLGDERVFGDRVVADADAVVTLVGGSDARAADRVVATVTDPVTAAVATRTYAVVGSGAPRTVE